MGETLPRPDVLVEQVFEAPSPTLIPPNLPVVMITALDPEEERVKGLDAGADIGIRDLESSRTGRVLVVGSEGKGLRRMVRQRCDIVVHIPQEGPMDSLNASVAAAIAMYEVAAKRGGASDEH